MCILIAKPKGAQFPAIEAVENSLINNPNGFSMAYNRANELVTFRTMSARRFMTQYRRIITELNPETTGMIIHARIATHGRIRLANCHCWVSFPGTPEEMAFAHNGILSIPARDGMTDSETFLRDWFEPCFIRSGWKGGTEIINRLIGSSKFAFIDTSGNIRKFGYFINEQDGCHYSNTSYMEGHARYADPRHWRSAI